MGSIASNLFLREKHGYSNDIELFKETQQAGLADEYSEKAIKSFTLYLNLMGDDGRVRVRHILLVLAVGRCSLIIGDLVY
jgi:hypothetical protein